jgi:hypothetical protein
MRTLRTPEPRDFNSHVAEDEAEHRDLLTQEQLDRAAERADCAIYDLHPGLLGHHPTNNAGRPVETSGPQNTKENTLHALPEK